jgi:NAD-dependent DNA ligase
MSIFICVLYVCMHVLQCVLSSTFRKVVYVPLYFFFLFSVNKKKVQYLCEFNYSNYLITTMVNNKKKNETYMQLYNNIGTRERRAVNRLLRAMSSSKVDQAELASICRSVSRLASTSTAHLDEPKRISGYILYYKERYAEARGKSPAASLGDLAKAIAAQWKQLPASEREAFNTRARSLH